MWILLAIVALPALYGLHRLCLRLEERGYLYYWHKKPKAGGTSAFLLLQEFYQPHIAHVIEAEDHSVERADNDRYLPDSLDPMRSKPTQLPPSPEDQTLK
ncbi:MAG: hypothetical protein WD063_20600 [Pirellulales bacterium]